MDNILKLATHNGQFHADEVLACVIIKEIKPSIVIIRTRDQEVIDKCDIVVDVGGVYDPDKQKFDHHQKGCNEMFEEYNGKGTIIPMSSAGMVWKHYGKQYLECRNVKKDKIDELWKSFYYFFVREVDAIDNGVKQHSEKGNYFINTNLSTMINKINNIDANDHDKQQIQFNEAINYTTSVVNIILKNLLDKYDNDIEYKKDYKLIETAFITAAATDYPEILIIKEPCNNWRLCVKQYEKYNPSKFKFIVHVNEDKWCVKTISDNFEPRQKIKTKDELVNLIKNNDQIEFVHQKQFIGVAHTLDVAFEMARLSLL